MNTCHLQVLGALVRYQLKRSSTLSQAFLNCLVSCLFFVLLSGASGSFQVWVDEGSVFWRRVSSTPCTFWQPGAFVCLLHVPSKGAAGPPMARDPTPMPLRLSRCFEFGSFGLEVHQIPLQSRPGHRGLYGRARLALSPRTPSHVQFAVLRLVLGGSIEAPEPSTVSRIMRVLPEALFCLLAAMAFAPTRTREGLRAEILRPQGW